MCPCHFLFYDSCVPQTCFPFSSLLHLMNLQLVSTLMLLVNFVKVWEPVLQPFVVLMIHLHSFTILDPHPNQEPSSPSLVHIFWWKMFSSSTQPVPVLISTTRYIMFHLHLVLLYFSLIIYISTNTCHVCHHPPQLHLIYLCTSIDKVIYTSVDKLQYNQGIFCSEYC